LKSFEYIIEREGALPDEFGDVLVLLLELLVVELFGDGLDLLVQLVIELLVLQGSLVELLVQASLLHSSVSHVIKLSQLNIIDGSLVLPEDTS
jgi:hypothetical protein